MADVLIVDDDRDIADAVTDVLCDAGHVCRVARNGHEGLRLVAERRPELVLLDVEMPIMSGPEMATALFLRNCGDEKIPVVLISGIVGLERIAAVVGTPYYLPKPCALAAVMQIVDCALMERVSPRPAQEALR
jgi:DNA-binding NtrC family response regulator